jgi:hypothetical protein
LTQAVGVCMPSIIIATLSQTIFILIFCSKKKRSGLFSEAFIDSDAAQHIRTCGKSTTARAGTCGKRAVNVRFFFRWGEMSPRKKRVFLMKTEGTLGVT